MSHVLHVRVLSVMRIKKKFDYYRSARIVSSVAWVKLKSNEFIPCSYIIIIIIYM